MDRKRFLVAIGVCPKQWAARYGIEPFRHPCGECGRELATTLPFACGELRGLLAPRCACGNERTPYGVVRDPRRGDLLTYLLT